MNKKTKSALRKKSKNIKLSYHELLVQMTNLQGLLENMAFGTCFWSSSVRYFGKAHRGKTVDGPENYQKKINSKVAHLC